MSSTSEATTYFENFLPVYENHALRNDDVRSDDLLSEDCQLAHGKVISVVFLGLHLAQSPAKAHVVFCQSSHGLTSRLLAE